MKEIKALIVSGGGMKCAYSAGAIYYLAKKKFLKNFDILIGGSGSVGALSYFCSGQYESEKNIWRNLVANDTVVDFLRMKKIIDIDFIIDVIFKKQEKLLEKKIHKFQKQYLIPTTNAKTGKVEYFSNKSKNNFFEIMRAGMAMPFLYNKFIKIGKKKFFDTPNSSSTKLNTLKAIELGATNILVIDNSDSSPYVKFWFNLWTLSRGKSFRKNYFSEDKKKNSEIPKKVKVFYIKPNKKLKIGLLENNKKILRKTFDLGVEDSKKFLKSLN